MRGSQGTKWNKIVQITQYDGIKMLKKLMIAKLCKLDESINDEENVLLMIG